MNRRPVYGYEAYRRRQRRSDLAMATAVLGVVLVLGAAAGVYAAAASSSRHEQTCTVDDKDRTANPNGGSDTRIYTSDCGVLTVTDSVLAWNFHSADTYAAIQPGKTYAFTVQGWRVPFLSSFPNILAAQEVSP